MSSLAITVFAGAVVAFVAVSAWMARHQFSAPMVFTLIGVAIGLATSGVEADTSAVRALTETTLALILFHDAAMIRPAQLRADAGLAARLLLLGLPLTMLAGVATALLLVPTIGFWLALFLASALAPTDAGLGAATVLNPVVPERIRRVLNVESGLNDGLSTPVVLVSIGALAAATSETESGHVIATVEELLIGVLVGVAVGAAAGGALRRARRAGLAVSDLIPLAVTATPLLAYYGAATLGGNGFVAAFLAGTAYAAAYHGRGRRSAAADAAPGPNTQETTTALTESISTLLGFAVWTLFGVIGVTEMAKHLSWAAVAFAVLSLTALRMLPVALVLVGTGFRRRTVLFIGWFGPRGLASVVFTLIAVQSLEASSTVAAVLATVELTILLSVVLHGLTAGPWADRYGAWAARVAPTQELQDGAPA